VCDLGRAPHAKTMAALSQGLLGDGSGQEVPEVRLAAAETIGKSFDKVPNSWKPLATVAKNRDKKLTEVRIAAVHSMGQIAARESLRSLQDLVDDTPFEMAKEAVDALAVIPDKSTGPLPPKLLREAGRWPEDRIRPEVPCHGVGLAGPVIDDARSEQIARRKVLMNPTIDTLQSLSGQKFTAFKDWQKWWSANGSSFKVQGKKG